MGSIDDIMQLCRLCLVKDQVNIPIFDETSDIRQTFLKINQCLPVKVSRDDNLPKKICDGCSYKLDMLYVFRNTSVDSEKQLISWLNQAGLGSCSLPQTIVKDGVTKPEIMVKQETFETAETRLESENPELNQELGVDTHSYIIQQQKLPYQQDFAAFGESSASTNLVSEEPPPKKAKRAAATKKQVPLETDEDALETAMQITKAEEEDSDDVDQPDYVEAPSTSAEDQPGPSGVGKGTIEAPDLYQDHLYSTPSYPEITSLQCKYLMSIVDSKDSDLADAILDENDADLLNLLSTEEDCADILNNIANNEQFEKLINGETNFVDEFIDQMKEEAKKAAVEAATDETTNAANVFKCNECSKGFKTKKLLKKHLFIHTGVKKFSCDICDKSFKYRYEVDVHKKSHNNPTFQCDICSKMFIHKSHLTTHRRKHLNEFVDFCNECNMGFVSKFAYKSHVDLVHKNMKLMCDECGIQLSSHSALKEHKITHDPNYRKERTFVCEVCGKSYLTSRNLKGHMKVHQQLKAHVCNICGKSVSSKKILETHIKMHTGLRDFICTVCGKGFASKEYLDVHMRIHTGNKPFCCEVCGKRFTQKTSLTVHMRHHTGQRPYKCECGKEFTTKSHLMAHYKAHDVGGVDIDYLTDTLLL